MSTKFKNLKNDLKDLEEDTVSQLNGDSGTKTANNRLPNYILLFAFIATLIFYVGSRIDAPQISIPNPAEIAQSFNAPSEQVIEQRGAMFEEMGYGEMSRERLIELGNLGVTATYTSQIRELGYTDITIEQLIELQEADVSATYARMMQELGYDLTVEDLVETRNNGVTAYFTSNMMDLGYTMEELSKENLIRMRRIGVNFTDAERLIEQNGARPSVDELIRYRISNQ